VNEKWIVFSRRMWGHVLTWGSAAMLLLSAATPETVTWAAQPFLAFCAALGWEPAPDLQERALRATLALSGIIGVVAKLRSRVAPDNAKLTIAPSTENFMGKGA
jgi:hypothetical protein